MTMFSEIQSEMTAEKLEKILTYAVVEGGAVKEFAKKYLYDWYLWECSETFGSYPTNPMIKREFEEEDEKKE